MTSPETADSSRSLRFQFPPVDRGLPASWRQRRRLLELGARAAAPSAPRGRFGGGPNEVVSVRVVPVQKATIDVDVRALGTVTPFNTVTVRSRLDGELVRVLFTEGQHVSAGGLLAEIDSRALPGRSSPRRRDSWRRTARGSRTPRATSPAYQRLAERGPDHQAAGDHAGSAGAAVPGCASGKRGAGEHRPAAARVHADCRSHRRPAGAPAGGRG